MAVSKADCGVLHRVLRGASIVVVRLSVQLYQSGCSDSSQRGCNGLAAMAVAGGVWLRGSNRLVTTTSVMLIIDEG
jgi:hypothetical protein